MASCWFGRHLSNNVVSVMFTGIIEDCGSIIDVQQGNDVARFKIACEYSDLVEGESIAVDGVCLTVSAMGLGYFCCDVSPETKRLTTFASVGKDCLVNLERSLRVSDRFGGHFVTGHVDQTCRVGKIIHHGECVEILFSGMSESAQAFVIKKGSIAVNGVSLTINEVVEGGFQVLLIPHTLKKTNLTEMKAGESVNIEFDLLAKTIAAQIQIQSECV